MSWGQYLRCGSYPCTGLRCHPGLFVVLAHARRTSQHGCPVPHQVRVLVTLHLAQIHNIFEGLFASRFCISVPIEIVLSERVESYGQIVQGVYA